MEVTINYNGQAVAVEVTLEVYEFLDQADHNRSEQCIGRTAKYSRIAKCCTDHRGNTEQISCKDSQ